MTLTRFSGTVIALSFAYTPAYSQTQTVSHTKSDIEHVLVTIPIHKTDAQTALPITLLTSDQLRDLATQNIGDTLGNLPGLSNASFGPSVGQPVIRGQQGPRVSVLQNGTGSGDASNVSADHAVSVEPVLAESIEVLRGPNTLLYGGGAIGGIINVIDSRIPKKVPEQLQGTAEVRHGSVNDETTGVFKLEGGTGDIAFYLSGLTRQTNHTEIPGLAILETHDDHAEEEEEHENTNGFIANSDSDMESFTLGTSYVFDQGFIGIAVNRLDNEYGIPPGAHAHDEEHEGEEQIRLNLEQTRYDLRGGIFSEQHNIETLRWAMTYNDYQHDEIEGDGSIGTTFSNDSWEGRVELVHTEINGFHGAVGLQFESTEFAAVGEESFIPETDINSVGLFVVEDFHLNNVIYEMGLRLDQDSFDPQSISNKKDFDSISVSGSALWQINDDWRLGVALSSSERAPITEELFSNVGNSVGGYITHAASGVIELGNTHLDTEQANNIDLSLHYQTDYINGFFTVYYNAFSNYIYLANTGGEQDETKIFGYTQEDATFTGVEFDVSFMLATVWDGNVELRLFGDTITGELDNNLDVPRMPASRIGSTLSFHRDALKTYVSVLDAADQDNPGLFETETQGYTRWDAGLSYTFNEGGDNEYLTFIRLKNITDEKIRSSVSFLRNNAPEAGRSIEAGVRFSF